MSAAPVQAGAEDEETPIDVSRGIAAPVHDRVRRCAMLLSLVRPSCLAPSRSLDVSPARAARRQSGRAIARGLFAAFLAAFLFSCALAQDLVPVPPLKGRVTDLTGTLTAEQVASLERSLTEFERRKGSQIAVLMVPTTKPEAIDQYSIRVAEQWKVGRRKVDDGVIIVVAKNDHRVRLEVGYGLEGPIPDAIASRVIREVIAPHFVQGDFYGGLRDGTARLMKLIEGESLPPPRQAADRRDDESYESLFVIVLMLVVAGGAILTRILGRFFGSAAIGGIAGVVVLLIVGSMIAAVIAGIIAFFSTFVLGAVGRGFAGHRHGGWGGGISPGGWSGGGWGSSSGGGWSGGGGSFGGGGASGSWD